MNIKDFSYIAAVVEYGSYSKAAEALYLSQPSLSAYIHGLEKQLGIRFFKNDRRTLTSEGKVYLSYAQKIIDLDTKLMTDLEQMQRIKKQKFLIGITPGRADQYLDTLYYRLNCPDSASSVNFSMDTSQNLIQKVLSGELDFILLNDPMNTKALSCQTIFTDRLLLAVNKHHPVTQKAYMVPGSKHPYLPADALGELPYILLPEGRSMRTVFDKFCRHMNITPKIVQEVLSIRSACRLVSRGLGATLLFDIPQEFSYLNDEANCYYVDTEDLMVDFVVAFDKKRPTERAGRKIIKEIKDTVNSMN